MGLSAIPWDSVSVSVFHSYRVPSKISSTEFSRFLYAAGKTLQALIGIAITHVDRDTCTTDEPHSLVVCPSSVVGHWAAEIEKFFPGQSIFRSLSYIGTETERKALWKCAFTKCNIVVTSYSVLRSDADTLSKHMWRFVILDEGHLLKNPKTGT